MSALQVEPRLARGIIDAELEYAERSCITRRETWVGRSQTTWSSMADRLADGHLLLEEGHCLVRTTLGDDQRCVEVVGPGDLLAAELDDDDADLTVDLRILTPVSVVVLDEAFLRTSAPWPKVAHNVTALALRRGSELARSLALMHVANLTSRLHFVLWRLATRWGRVTPAGVRLPFVIQQGALADLVGARRPSVNAALSGLKSIEAVSEDLDGRLRITEPIGDSEPGT